jgi:hypothetical protein
VRPVINSHLSRGLESRTGFFKDKLFVYFSERKAQKLATLCKYEYIDF